jgi:hypothetical protein
MTEYRITKKPVTVTATPFYGTNPGQVKDFTGVENFHLLDEPYQAESRTVIAEVFDRLHGTWVGVAAGQWIICGVKGEFYPCDLEVLHATYEAPEGGWPA